MAKTTAGKASRSYKEDLLERLRRPDYAAEYLNAALEEDDTPTFLVALHDVAEAYGFTRLAEEAGLNRPALYRALSEGGNPRLDSLTALFRALDLQFAVKAKAA